jgi:hypothetical protein
MRTRFEEKSCEYCGEKFIPTGPRSSFCTPCRQNKYKKPGNLSPKEKARLEASVSKKLGNPAKK